MAFDKDLDLRELTEAEKKNIPLNPHVLKAQQVYAKINKVRLQ